MKEVHLFVHCVIMWNNARWLGKKNNETCSVEQKYFLCRSGFLSIAIFSIVLTVLKNHFGSNATPYRNFASLPTAGLEKHKLQLNIKYAAFWFIFWNYLFILNIFTFNLYTTGFQKKTQLWFIQRSILQYLACTYQHPLLTGCALVSKWC